MLDPQAESALRRRFRKMMVAGAFTSVGIGLGAAAIVAIGTANPSPHLLIATALGCGLSVMMAAALMGLMFLSHRSGHDDDAGHLPDERD